MDLAWRATRASMRSLEDRFRVSLRNPSAFKIFAKTLKGNPRDKPKTLPASRFDRSKPTFFATRGGTHLHGLADLGMLSAHDRPIISKPHGKKKGGNRPLKTGDGSKDQNEMVVVPHYSRLILLVEISIKQMAWHSRNSWHLMTLMLAFLQIHARWACFHVSSLEKAAGWRWFPHHDMSSPSFAFWTSNLWSEIVPSAWFTANSSTVQSHRSLGKKVPWKCLFQSLSFLCSFHKNSTWILMGQVAWLLPRGS